MLFFHRNRKPKPKQKLTVRRSNRTNYKEVMNCFRSSRRKNLSSPNTTITSPPPETMFPPETEAKKPKQEMLLNIPGCTVNLVEEGETVELAKGYFTIVRLYDENVSLATVIKVGDELQWPLTKDEPVVKLDRLHYLFSLPMKDRELLSYGVSFSEQFSSELEKLDSFLKEHSCFSGIPSTSPAASGDGRVLEWKDFAPRIEDYNGVLAKAIAGTTGQIIKGIFNISNAYSKQVHKGGEMIINRAAEQKNGVPVADSTSNQSTKGTKKSGVNKGLKRVRKISKMTEKMSKTLLNTVGIATGSVVGPMVRSQAGKSFLAMVPGEVLLASLDAVNQVLDAAEAAEKQALSATSKAATRVVSKKFGENAGEATGDAFATAGHVAGTAWNIFKIRKAINPASSVPSAIVKNAVKKK